jgi:hypothetical protein
MRLLLLQMYLLTELLLYQRLSTDAGESLLYWFLVLNMEKDNSYRVLRLVHLIQEELTSLIFKTFSNKPIIMKDYYEVSGSDVSKIGWVEVTSEEGAKLVTYGT